MYDIRLLLFSCPLWEDILRLSSYHFIRTYYFFRDFLYVFLLCGPIDYLVWDKHRICFKCFKRTVRVPYKFVVSMDLLLLVKTIITQRNRYVLSTWYFTCFYPSRFSLTCYDTTMFCKELNDNEWILAGSEGLFT